MQSGGIEAAKENGVRLERGWIGESGDEEGGWSRYGDEEGGWSIYGDEKGGWREI